MIHSKAGAERQSAEPAPFAANANEWQDYPRLRFDIKTLDVSSPVVLLGGRENTLAVTRNFGRLGINVYVSGRRGCHALYSRHCHRAFPVEPGVSAAQAWHERLRMRANNKAATYLWFVSFLSL